MELSVIIPTYNRDRVLCDTLDLLFKQTDKNFEIIVVDQSKKHDDYTVAFLGKERANYRLFTLPVANLPAARNFGLTRANGEIILFLDDDVLFQEDFISKVKEVFWRHAEADGITGLSRSKNQPDHMRWNIVPDKFRDEAIKTISEGRIWPVQYLPGFFMAFRKNVLVNVGGFDEWIGTQPMAANEDGELCLRLRLKGYRLFVAPTISIIHLVEEMGGCEVRTKYEERQDKIRYNQFRMGVYGLMKNKKLFTFFDYQLTRLKYLHNYFSTYNYDLKKMPRLFWNFVKIQADIRQQIFSKKT